LQMERIRRRVHETCRATLSWDPALEEVIAARCTESSSGARNVENILSRTLLPELSVEVLSRLAEGVPIEHVHVGLDPDGSFQYDIGRPARTAPEYRSALLFEER
jgi:type VI secretion system protein VasG